MVMNIGLSPQHLAQARFIVVDSGQCNKVNLGRKMAADLLGKSIVLSNVHKHVLKTM